MRDLTSNDERVLACAQLNAELSISEIARRTRVTEPSVRRTLAKLEDRGIIRKLWYVDVYALGDTLYNIWFTLSAPKSSIRPKLIQYLVAASEVEFFVELTGHFQYSVTVRTKSLVDFVDFTSALSERFGGCFLEHSTATVVHLSDLPLVKHPRFSNVRQSFEIGVVSEHVLIDELDQRILSELASVPSASIAQISRNLGLPTSTIQYRFNQLTAQGVIAGCRYFIDYLKLGYSFTYHQLSLSGASVQDSRRLKEHLSAHPAVYYVEQCVGAWQLEIGTVTKRITDLTSFTGTLYDTFGGIIARLESSSVARFLKLNGAPITSSLTEGASIIG